MVLNKLFSQEIPGIDDQIKDYEDPKKRKWNKPKKVLIINGNPRMKAGFTYFYLRPLIKGIEKADVIVEIVDVYDPKIKEICLRKLV